MNSKELSISVARNAREVVGGGVTTNVAIGVSVRYLWLLSELYANHAHDRACSCLRVPGQRNAIQRHESATSDKNSILRA